MDFELDDDQLELQRVVHDIVGRECPPALVRSVVAGQDDGTGLWKTFVGLDWPLLTVPAEDGGMDASAIELAIVLEELGYAADPTPFLATTSQYVPIIRECGDPELRRTLLEAVVAGHTGAVAYAAYDVHARPDGGDWVLEGIARHVIDGDRADELAVVTSDDGAVSVFVVPAEAIRATRTPTFDATLHVADIDLDGVRVPGARALRGPQIRAKVKRAHQEAVGGLAATMVGACQRILDLALVHVKERHQFGVPIGSFQAVKHLAVDVYVAIERARALSHFAALTIAEDDDRRELAASMAKAAAGDAQRITAQHGIQLFGGLGFTWENDLQLYVRRAKAGELLLGSSVEHRRRVARLVLAERPPTASRTASHAEEAR